MYTKTRHVYLLTTKKKRSVLTATISCLVLIGKKRPQFLKEIIKAFTSWKKDKDESPVMLRNVNKALKLAFISLIR